MKETLLALNTGSSSIKFTLYDCPDTDDGPPSHRARGLIERIGLEGTRFLLHREEGQSCAPDRILGDGIGHERALYTLLDWIDQEIGNSRLAVVGHRIVHGGPVRHEPCFIDPTVLEELERLVPLAPLHQPHNLAAVRILSARDPDLPQVACFDTAFHHTQPELAQRFALPQEYWKRGVRRYGFHGLSYEYIAGVLPRHLPPHQYRRVVVAHLGNGASLCALRELRSVATSMGMTPLDGLPMGTRCGSLDPGVVLYLLQQEEMTVEQINELLYRHSGLLGVSGLSADVRVLLASARPEARLALDLFCYHIVRQIGALTALLDGLDALVFTGGIGEHATAVREQVCKRLGWLGLQLDVGANRGNRTDISGQNSAVRVLVIPTDEDAVIAKHTHRLLRNGA